MLLPETLIFPNCGELLGVGMVQRHTPSPERHGHGDEEVPVCCQRLELDGQGKHVEDGVQGTVEEAGLLEHLQPEEIQ